MNMTSKPLAAIILFCMFGGIALSAALGWWNTESSKQPAAFAQGEFAGLPNPADIRGSYTFGDISRSFGIEPDIVARAFGVSRDDPSGFAVKELEALYLDSVYEIGTASVRLFVAFYAGLPFDLSGQEIYLPASAAQVLMEKGSLSPEQVDYLEAHTAPATPAAEALPTTGVSMPAEDKAYIIKGKTTFGELITWGVPQAVIEQIIAGPLPSPAMTVKDYAAANGLEFETLKLALQAEVDKVKP